VTSPPPAEDLRGWAGRQLERVHDRIDRIEERMREDASQSSERWADVTARLSAIEATTEATLGALRETSERSSAFWGGVLGLARLLLDRITQPSRGLLALAVLVLLALGALSVADLRGASSIIAAEALRFIPAEEPTAETDEPVAEDPPTSPTETDDTEGE